jgi:hypothetical protein
VSCITEAKIRTRAFELWKAAGEPSGQMDRFWYQAERELILENTLRQPNDQRTPL